MNVAGDARLCLACGEVFVKRHDCPGRAPEKVVTSSNEQQVGGDHYKKLAIQPWDYIAANNLGYFEGAAIKYLSRWKDKGGVEDLRKAIHFIEKLIEIHDRK